MESTHDPESTPCLSSFLRILQGIGQGEACRVDSVLATYLLSDAVLHAFCPVPSLKLLQPCSPEAIRIALQSWGLRDGLPLVHAHGI